MTYKLKNPRKKIPTSYWEKREVTELRKKYPHRHLPPALQITRTATRRVAGIPEKIHRKGAIVQYKEKIGQIKKVTKRGLWIETFTKPTEKELAYPTGKVVFVPEKRAEKEVYPFFTRLPIYFVPPFEIR